MRDDAIMTAVRHCRAWVRAGHPAAHWVWEVAQFYRGRLSHAELRGIARLVEDDHAKRMDEERRALVTMMGGAR